MSTVTPGTGIGGETIIEMDDISCPDAGVDPSVEWFRGRYRAEAPIAHGADSRSGTTQRFRTEQVGVTDPETGEQYTEDVPCISGNSFRGHLRDLLAEDFMRLLDEPYDEDTQLGDTLFSVLWSGGVLERGTGPGKLKRRFIEDIREHIPPLSLLGSSAGTEVWEGRLKVGYLWPVCFETASETNVDGQKSVYGTYLDVTYGTRVDDREGAREGGQAVSQMHYRIVVLQKGTPLVHRMALKGATDIERACFGRAMDLFASQPFVGGGSARGFGRVSFEYDHLPDADPYVEYIRDNRDEILEFVHDLDGRLS